MWNGILKLQSSNYDSPNRLASLARTEKFIDCISKLRVGMYIKDKRQILSCSHPSSIRQSESYSQNANWIMSLPCSVSSVVFQGSSEKNLQGLFCGLIPKSRLPRCSLVPAPESHSSIISSLFPCATRCSSLFCCNISSSVTSAYLPLPPNHCPVSLLPFNCKLLERTVYILQQLFSLHILLVFCSEVLAFTFS